MIEYMKMRPMLTCAVFAVILCLASFYWKWVPLIGFIAITALFLLFLIFKVRTVSLFALAMLAPVCLSLFSINDTIRGFVRYDKTRLSGTFIVTEAPVNHGTFDSVIAEIKDAPPFPNGERILIRGTLSDYEMGNIISANLVLSRMDQNKYKNSWYSEGVYIAGDTKKTSLIARDGDPILSAVRKLRIAIEKRFFTSMGRDEAATLSAVLLGDKTHLDERFEALVTAAGVNHMMVVSGLHLAIMMELILRLTRRISHAPAVRFVVIVFTTGFLTVLCGFTKSILRASLCLIIYAVGLLLGRGHTPENTLGGAVVLLLIASPFLIFSVSFQLSVLSTLGILVCALPLSQMAEKKSIFRNRLIQGAFSAVAVTAGATCFALPITLYTFGGTSVIGIVSNLLLVPVMTPMLMITVILLMICLPIPFLAPLTMWAPGFLALYVNSVIKTLGGLPFSYVYVNAFEKRLSVLLPLLLFYGSVMMQKREKIQNRAKFIKKC